MFSSKHLPIFFFHVEQMKTGHFNINSNGTKFFELHSIRQLQVYSEPYLSKLVVRLAEIYIMKNSLVNECCQVSLL